ncbi:MAG TPA: 1-deoxy-D-xylulose-5-phosphate reductoisomerase [Victivallales bacterium]|nr:1-deoxy-D-xylulose-5-phosphate reductoisomerase [Victivallales bacterium]
MKKIVIIGSTGSIGENAFKVAQHLKNIKVVGLAAKQNYKRLAEQSTILRTPNIAIFDQSLKKNLAKVACKGTKIFSGSSGVSEMIKKSSPDLVVCASSGIAGFDAVLSAIDAGADIAIANKEVIVLAGEIVTERAKRKNVRIIPVDSEHSAISQCLNGNELSDVRRLILTASGGPFRNMSPAKIAKATAKSALLHPTWRMGLKTTIDSATLMNKALEIIEAHWLFGLHRSKIDVVIHPQSVIHSMVEFIDGSILAQMSEPDMKLPIQYAISYPLRMEGILKPFDFAKFAKLSFEIPDRKKFPSLDFAYEALKAGGTMPAVMNAANEVAVEKFLRGEINIPGIWKIIGNAMSRHKTVKKPNIAEILAADSETRKSASS